MSLSNTLLLHSLRNLCVNIVWIPTPLPHQVYLNGTPPPLKQACFVQPGDVVSPAPDGLSAYKASLAGEMGALLRDVHRDFLQ